MRVVWDDGELDVTADDSPVLIGRSAHARVRLTERTVSRVHLRLLFENGSWIAVDESTRGTYRADGTRITRLAVGRDEVALRLASSDGPAIRLVALAASAAPAGSSPATRAARAAGSSVATVRDRVARLARSTGPWGRRRVATLLATVLAGAAVSYVANLWLVARHYDGSTNVPPGAPVTAGADHAQALVLWFLVMAIASALATQLVLFGPRAVGAKVVAAPARLRSIPAGMGRRGVFAAMAGAGIALVVGGLLIPALRGTLGLGILLFLPFAVGHGVVMVVSRVATTVATSMSRTIADPQATAGSWLVGAGVGLTAGYLVSSPVVRVVLAVGLVAAAVRGGRRTPAVTALVIAAAGTLVVDWLVATAALADDGGWTECGGTWSDLRGCAGAGEVFDGARDAAAAGGCGAACGGTLAGDPRPPAGQRKEPGYWEEDLDGDGDPDAFYFDTDGDGTWDRFEYDHNDDGIIDEVAYDDDGDGSPDRFYTDKDQDGRYETVEHDRAHRRPEYPDWPDPDAGGESEDGPAGSEASRPEYPDWPDPDAGGESVDGPAGGEASRPSIRTTELDTNDDGRPDEWREDVDGDGVADIIRYDDDADGTPDRTREYHDTTGDGHPDEAREDLDGDGVADIIRYDDDADGTPDRVVVYEDLDGDGRVDGWAEDSDADGQPDRYGSIGATPGTGGDGDDDVLFEVEAYTDADGDGRPDDP
jgi:hypothetical protein